jgi:sugar porter (SP) family MFS transporter
MKSKLLYTGLVSLVVALGGFLMGFDAGVVSGANPFYKDYFFLGDGALGWSVGCLTFGAMFGNLIAGPLADRFGRKPVLSMAALFFTVSAISSALATDFNFFIVARMLGGVAVGLALLIAPVYIAEIAPSRLRGRFVSFNQLNIVIGFSAVFFSNYYILKLAEAGTLDSLTKPNCWRWMLGAETVPAVLYFIFLFFVPRSPRWLAQRGREDEALAVLNKVLSPEEASESLQAIKEHIAGDKQSKPKVRELFSRNMRFIIFIALGLGFFQQITGINAIFYYAPTIFEKTGIPQENAFLQTIIIGLVNLGFTVVAIYIIDKFGRKPLLLIGTAAMAVCLFANAWAFQSATYTLSVEALKTVPEAISKALSPMVGQTYNSEKVFSADAAELIKPAVQGSSDFESSLPKTIRSSFVMLDNSAFTDVDAFEKAMETAVGEQAYVRELPVSGKNALRALNKESFESRSAFVSAINSFNDDRMISEHQAALVKDSMSISARLVLFAIMGYIAAFAISLGPVMWAMFSEIFPNRLRGLAISLAGFFNSLVSYAVQQIFPWELSTLGPAGTFLIFGVFATLAFVFTIKFIPETKGKSLEELEEILIKN